MTSARLVPGQFLTMNFILGLFCRFSTWPDLVTSQLGRFPPRSRPCNTAQCSQNVDVNGPHHGPYQLMASSSLHSHRLVEWGRHNELEASMVGAVYVRVLRILIQTEFARQGSGQKPFCNGANWGNFHMWRKTWFKKKCKLKFFVKMWLSEKCKLFTIFFIIYYL